MAQIYATIFVCTDLVLKLFCIFLEEEERRRRRKNQLTSARPVGFAAGKNFRRSFERCAIFHQFWQLSAIQNDLMENPYKENQTTMIYVDIQDKKSQGASINAIRKILGFF